MSDLQSPTVLNPSVLIPVNPAIESYMGSLLRHTDHSMLIEMEKFWRKRIASLSLVIIQKSGYWLKTGFALAVFILLTMYFGVAG
jgi:hypothetical protein